MPIDVQAQPRAKSKQRRATWETADATKRAAHEHESRARQLTAKQALAATNTAEIAKQAGREKDTTAHEARKEWDERIRSILAATKPDAQLLMDAPRLSSDLAIPDTTAERLSRVDAVPAEPTDIMTDQTKRPLLLATLNNNKATNIAARDDVSVSQLRNTERLAGLHSPSLNQVATDIPEGVDSASTARALIAAFTSLHSPSLNQVVPDVSWNSVLAPIAQSLPAAFASLHSPSLEKAAQVFPEVPSVVHSPPMAQSLSAMFASPQSPSLDQVVPNVSRSAASTPMARSLSAVFASPQSPSLDQVVPNVSRSAALAPMAWSLSGVLTSSHSPSPYRAARGSPDVSNWVYPTSMAQSLSPAFASGMQDPETARWLEEATRASSPDIICNQTIQLPKIRDADDQRSPDRFQSLAIDRRIPPERRFEPMLSGIMQQEGQHRFDRQEIIAQLRTSLGAEPQRSILEPATATGISMPGISATGAESTSFLARERLLGAADPTRGTGGGAQGPSIDLDRLTRAIEMFIQGLDRFTGRAQLPALEAGGSQTASVPPALPAKPVPFVGRTDGSGVLF